MAEKTKIVFESLSTANGGTRDVSIDLTNLLETSETVDTVSVLSPDDNVLTATNEQKNSLAITRRDGTEVAIGKAVQFQLASVAVVKDDREMLLDMIVEGTSGTKETYELLVPLVWKKRA